MIVNKKMRMPCGFKAAGLYAGIKRARKDMAMIFSEAECSSAGTFTTNRVKAAPVKYDMSVLKSAKHGIVINSGNANACTSQKGDEDAKRMAELAASSLSVAKDSFYVCSTGVIGVPLDMGKIKHGISMLVPCLSSDGHSASEAIMTTDTFPKEAAASVEINGKTVTVGGMSKGSGMIHPNMATTLSFITTDAAVSKKDLQALLGTTVDDTYNMVSVDGDTSTNDTVLVLANGMAGNDLLTPGTEEWSLFEEAFRYVLGTLARYLARDGEGATRFIEMDVENALTKKDAKILARSVVSSSLVKAAFFGADANWGRILCAMGYSGADFDPSLVDLSFTSPAGTIQVVKNGEPLPFDEEVAKKILSEKEITAVADCHQGVFSAQAWGCDLTYDYVKINGDYRS